MVDHSGTAPESATPFCQGIKLQFFNIIRHNYLCVNQIRPTTTFRERGNYKINKNTMATTTTPMAKL